MIKEIGINGLGVIASARLELGPGLTVLTGETGAGKTMVLSGVRLLMGERFDSKLASGQHASVEGVWELPHDHPAVQRGIAAGGTCDEVDGTSQLIIGRSLPTAGRGRCVLGGSTIPVALMQEIAPQLLQIHGQSDQLFIKKPAVQRETLDSFAGPELDATLVRYRQAFEDVRRLEAAMIDRRNNSMERARERDMLAYGLKEIDQVRPVAGEDLEIERDISRLDHVEALRIGAHRVLSLLAGDEQDPDGANALTSLTGARKSLSGAVELDDHLAESLARLTEVIDSTADVASDVSRYLSSLDADPMRLAQLQERKAALKSLTRKYGDTIDEVLAWESSAAERHTELNDDESSLDQLAQQLQEAKSLAGVHAGELHRMRLEAAKAFGDRVTDELRTLAMANAEVRVLIGTEPNPDGLLVSHFSDPCSYSSSGIDAVAIELRAHSGSEYAAIGSGASGGELSRIMLAMEVVRATGSADAPLPTMVFDEIDAGVGGKAAVEIGRRLSRLARTHQVLVVTHLPQVAAFGDTHLVVSKNDDGTVTTSDVMQVQGSDRVRELARMLAGQEESAHATAHAAELIALAELERTG